MALISNKKATFNYEILTRFEAGVELFGYEVKAIRNGMGSLAGAHVIVRGDEAFLVHATIPPFQPANTPASYDPERARKLLLTQKEIANMKAQSEQKGLTIVPISMYNKGRNIKLEVAVVRGKKKTDKRETIKARDSKRDIERTLKNQY